MWNHLSDVSGSATVRRLMPGKIWPVGFRSASATTQLWTARTTPGVNAAAARLSLSSCQTSSWSEKVTRSPLHLPAALRKVFAKPSRDSFTCTCTGKGLTSAKSCRIATVASVDPSSQATSSSGRRLWRAMLSSCSRRNRSPLKVAIATEIRTSAQACEGLVERLVLASDALDVVVHRAPPGRVSHRRSEVVVGCEPLERREQLARLVAGRKDSDLGVDQLRRSGRRRRDDRKPACHRLEQAVRHPFTERGKREHVRRPQVLSRVRHRACEVDVGLQGGLPNLRSQLRLGVVSRSSRPADEDEADVCTAEGQLGERCHEALHSL